MAIPELLFSPASRVSRIKQLWVAQHELCFLCLESFTLDNVSREHVVPKSMGGGNGDNVVLAHRRCNNKRKAKKPTVEQLARLAKLNAAIEVMTPFEVIAWIRANELRIKGRQPRAIE